MKTPPLLYSAKAFVVSYLMFCNILKAVYFFIKIKNKNMQKLLLNL